MQEMFERGDGGFSADKAGLQRGEIIPDLVRITLAWLHRRRSRAEAIPNCGLSWVAIEGELRGHFSTTLRSGCVLYHEEYQGVFELAGQGIHLRSGAGRDAGTVTSNT